MNVHSGFICINKTKEKKELPPQKKETQGMDKQIGVYLYNRILLSNEDEWTIDIYMWMNLFFL